MFRLDVEGLRAIAVVMVLVDHAGLSSLSGGHVGVDVFFVLSGFLITGLLLREFETRGSVSLTRFYARRARRLLPAGSLVLVVTVFASYAYLGESRANRVATHARWSSLFASNFRSIEQGTDYLDLSVDGKPTTKGLDEAWETGLASMIGQLTDGIIVIGDMAYPAEPGIDCLTAHPNDVPACNASRDHAVYEEHNAMEKSVATQSGAEYVDVIPWFCTDTVCPAVVGGLTTHRDAYHVAENYAVWLSVALGAATGVLPDDTRQ